MSCSKMLSLLFAMLLCPSLSGCATLLSDRSYQVTIDNAAGPTYFSVMDRDNKVVQSGLTPQQVTLRSSAGPFRPAKYRIVYASTTGVHEQPLDPNINWWTAGNIVIGGVPGVVIDAASGALWRLDDRVTGRVPMDQLVSNPQQGNAMLAGRVEGIPTQTAGPPSEQGSLSGPVRSASYSSPSDQEQ
ncbi:MAG: hypothetical protein JNM43_25290 [Planctomycetaceae bacterium]|nr:hypothetical protein [Planctomycetaceae bacterium]